MKKLIVYSILAISLVMPVSVFADEDGDGEGIRDAMRLHRDEVKTDIMEMRDEFRQNLEEKRAELRGEIEEKRAELKERLKSIRDEQKKQRVERIDQRLDALNERMVNHFNNVLDRLGNILDRIASRADKAEDRGLDVSTVRIVIQEALDAIDAAHTAVSEQSGKTCIINVTTEDHLKIDVGAARKCLHDSLVAVREIVKAARDAVREAAVALAQIPRVDDESNSNTTNETDANGDEINENQE